MQETRYWRYQRQRHSLIGEECECDEKIFPPRDICPECDANTLKNGDADMRRVRVGWGFLEKERRR